MKLGALFSRVARGSRNRLPTSCCKKNSGTPTGAQQKKATPLPLGKVLVVGSVLFVNHFSMLMIFPFLPFMVKQFFPELSTEELGQKAGFLGTSFFVGTFMGSFFWGWLSDVWGRRPVMLLGICGTTFSVLLFGFSQTFAWAVIVRFFWGLLNGNIGVAKTYLSEVCDDTNQAKGFSIIALSASIGRLVGPTVGGFLAQPASKYAIFQTPFFCQFPFLLPCLFQVLVGIFSFIAAFLFLEETLYDTMKQAAETGKQNGHVPQQDNSSKDEEDSSDTASLDSTDTNVEMVSLVSETEQQGEELNGHLTNRIAESDLDTQSDHTIVNTDTELLINDGDSDEEKHKERGGFGVQVKNRCRLYLKSLWTKLTQIDPAAICRQLVIRQKKQCQLCLCCGEPGSTSTRSKRGCLKTVRECSLGKVWQWVWYRVRLVLDRRVFIAILLYGLSGFVGLMTNEVIPLLLVTDYPHGGFNMTDADIGLFIMCVACVQIFFQPYIFPRIIKLLGYRHTYQAAMMVFAASCVILPFSNQITGSVVIASNTTNCTLDDGSGCGSGAEPNITTDYCQQQHSGGEKVLSNLPAVVWIVVMLVLLVHLVSRIVAMTSTMIMVGNSSLPATRGSVNGISQSQVAVFRAASPLIGALLFAWSERNGLGWPLNYHLVFVLCAIVATASVLLSCLMPKTIEKKREKTNST